MRPRALFMSASAAGLALALGALPAAAQHMNAKDAPCRGPGTTADDMACFSKAFGSRDNELSRLLATVRPVVEGQELALLDRAQAKWAEYRTLACDAEYAMYGGGSAGPTAQLACLEALTRDRIKQLHDGYDWRIKKRR